MIGVPVRIHIQIDDDLHRQAKAQAALRGQSLKDFITEAIAVAVRAASKGGRK